MKKLYEVVVGGVSVQTTPSKLEADIAFSEAIRSGMSRKMYQVVNGVKTLIQNSRSRGWKIEHIATFQQG